MSTCCIDAVATSRLMTACIAPDRPGKGDAETPGVDKVMSRSRYKRQVIRPFSQLVVVAEWLRRWTRNPLGSSRAGSNPADYDSFFFFFFPSFNPLPTNDAYMRHELP